MKQECLMGQYSLFKKNFNLDKSVLEEGWAPSFNGNMESLIISSKLLLHRSPWLQKIQYNQPKILPFNFLQWKIPISTSTWGPTTIQMWLPETLHTTSTISAMCGHLHIHMLLVTKVDAEISKKSVEPRTRNLSSWEVPTVGMTCRFPGEASSLAQLWQFIYNKKQTSSHIPFERWDFSSLTSRSNLSKNQKLRVSYGSFVDDIEFFDPSVFVIYNTHHFNFTQKPSWSWYNSSTGALPLNAWIEWHYW